jgi:hypothetical protein
MKEFVMIPDAATLPTTCSELAMARGTARNRRLSPPRNCEDNDFPPEMSRQIKTRSCFRIGAGATAGAGGPETDSDKVLEVTVNTDSRPEFVAQLGSGVSPVDDSDFAGLASAPLRGEHVSGARFFTGRVVLAPLSSRPGGSHRHFSANWR